MGLKSNMAARTRSKKASLEVKVGGVKFKNPVLVASGTFGYGEEFRPFMNVSCLGGIITKTLTLEPRAGNPPPRVVETPSGMLNAIGLQNVGVEAFLKTKYSFLKQLGIPVIASVMGASAKEFSDIVRILNKASGIAGFELNLSCPNVRYGKNGTSKMFSHHARMISDVVENARKETNKLLIAKLSPDVSDISKLAVSAQNAGADAVSLINTYAAMAININTRKPILGNRTGGLSGPCIRPIAVRIVYEAFKSIKIPIFGIGGIMNARDALEFIIAGATCVELGTVNFVNPSAATEVISGIKKFMVKNKIKSVKELIGSVE